MTQAPIRPPLRDNEKLVQQALRALDVLDSAPEAEFDALVNAAAIVCDVPIALFGLVETDREWFKANLGLPGLTQSPRETSFCAYAVAQDELFEVPDATLDARFASNPSVVGEPGIRFYAGAPVLLSDGSCIGTLCVLDRIPRRVTPRQREALTQLAYAAARALEGRLARKHARAATIELAASEARFKELSDGVPLGVFHSDNVGQLTYANPRCAEILGITDSECIGRGWARAISPFERTEILTAWDKAVLEQQNFDVRCRVVRRDGPWRDIRIRARPTRNSEGRAIGLIGSVEDTTVQSELLSLIERTGRLALVGGWEFDLRTKKVSWSAQTRAIHEAPSDYQPTVEEAIAFFSIEARPLLLNALTSSVSRNTTWDIELPLVTYQGKSKWVRALGEVEREGGRPVRLVGALQDVTELRHQRQELLQEQAMRAQITQQAIESERLLRERDEMLDVLAHEVRQPLNNASAALQGAARAMAAVEGSGVGKSLAKAQKVIGQVIGRIDNNLAVASLLARPEPIQRVETEIDLLLQLCAAELSAAQRVRLQIDWQTKTRSASMDVGLMRLALRNLLVNAMEYGDTKHPVVVRIGESEMPPAVLLDVVSAGGVMEPALLARLFRRGAQAHNRDARLKQGMGLGLYIVRRVMELHGGQAEVVENGPSSVTFRLTLPQAFD